MGELTTSAARLYPRGSSNLGPRRYRGSSGPNGQRLWLGGGGYNRPWRQRMSGAARARREAGGSVASIDAAALQSEMVKRFGLKPAGRRPSRHVVATPHQQHCLSCDSTVGDGQEYCVQCGYGVPRSGRDVSEPSLAQRRGLLVPMPPKPALDVMKPLDWYLIEKTIAHKSDPDVCCPICMERFSASEEVLLSCGHIFHKVCLRSFENFVKNPEISCPICRTKNYQKKLTKLGYSALERVSAARIQAAARGFLARREFKRMLRRHYRSGRGDESRRTKYLQGEFASVASRMDKSVTVRAQQLDGVMRSMDRTLQDGRQLDLLFEEMLLQRMGGNSSASTNGGATIPTAPASTLQSKPSAPADAELVCFDASEFCALAESTWGEVFAQAAARGHTDCAICMSSLLLASPTDLFGRALTTLSNPATVRKQAVLLSCSHAFHRHCLSSFEKFAKRLPCACPVCRGGYEKRLLPQAQ